jgi:hypothetical protein
MVDNVIVPDGKFPHRIVGWPEDWIEEAPASG